MTIGADQSLACAFAAAADAWPDAPLIVHSAARPATRRLGELVREGQLLGTTLRARGLRAGEVVAVQLPGWAEWLVAAVAVAHAGAVLLPVVAIYGAGELGFILRQSRARLLVTPDRWRSTDYRAVLGACGPLPDLDAHVVVGLVGENAGKAVRWDTLLAAARTMEPPTPHAPDALALLVYTSGTTAEPKGVMHSARTLLAELDQARRARPPIADEMGFSPWPPGHVAGVLSLLRHLVEGHPLVMMDQWDAAAAARLIEEYRVTTASFTPATLGAMLEAADRDGRDLASLASCLVGAAPVPSSLIERCATWGLRTFRSYGSSEHPTVSCGRPDDPLPKRLTTEGRPLPAVELRFVDEAGCDVSPGQDGEIATRGPDRFLGYLDPIANAHAFLPEGWYLTGDIGRLDADGYLLVTDRKKDIVIRGGENISSREVEEVLFRMPGVRDAAVVAAPDARLGEIVAAFVVVEPGATVELAAVRDHFAAAGVARQKTPERLLLVAELPRNATGKVLKPVLRARLRDGG